MEIQILPGVTLTVDDAQWSVKNAMHITPGNEPGADVAISLDMTITDVLEQSESKVQGIVGLRSV